MLLKFAHLADAHLGAWREPKMRDLSTQAFLQAIDYCIEKQVDFILLAGDLFNTSLPSLDILKTITKKLKQLQKENIPFYAIAGSHDFSPSGKTMLDVLENAGLLQNVCKGHVNPETQKLHLQFTVDKKTGAKLTGLLGRKGLLDRHYYENLALEPLEKEPGPKIFLFHTVLSELKPKHLENIDSQPLSFLPKNFIYYAGGHLHHPTQHAQPGYGLFTYPGALFPNSFAELEKYSHGGYYLVEIKEKEPKVSWIPIKVIEHLPLCLDCSHKSPEIIAFDLLNPLNQKDLINTLLTIRLTGILDKGRLSQIDFGHIFSRLYRQNAYFVMKNTAQLQPGQFEEIKIEASSPELLEEQLIREHLQQLKLFDVETELHLTKSLLQALNTEKKEGEVVKDFQQRVKEELTAILNLKEEMG